MSPLNARMKSNVRSYALDPNNAEALWKKAKKWSENRSNSLDRSDEHEQETRND
jgi:hypothetical protein